MRIGLVCKSVDPSRGGHERYINRLIVGLLDSGHDVTIYVRDTTVPDHLTSAGVEVVNVPHIHLGGALKRWSFNKFSKRLVRQHRSDLDLVFTTGKVDFGDVHRSGGGVHEVLLEQCEPRYRRWLPKNLVACRLERRLFEQGDCTIVVNSHMVRNQILDRFDTNPDRIEVIYNGVDTDRYDWPSLRSERSEVRERHGYTTSDFVCLFTGGSWRRKGLPYLLEALARVEDPSVQLIVAGHIDKQRMRNKTKKLHLSDRVTHIGYTDQLQRYYAAADALVFPSLYDAAANVVLEALASGLPVVSTATNGSSELIQDGENGYVIDRPEDVDAIAKAIEQLRAREDQLAMRESAYETGSTFTMERHLDQMEQVLESCST